MNIKEIANDTLQHISEYKVKRYQMMHYSDYWNIRDRDIKWYISTSIGRQETEIVNNTPQQLLEYKEKR